MSLVVVQIVDNLVDMDYSYYLVCLSLEGCFLFRWIHEVYILVQF